MTALVWAVALVAAVGAAWLMARCKLGFHGETVLEQVFDHDDRLGGKRLPYAVQWRCDRCHQIASKSEYRPSGKLMLSLHLERKKVATESGRVLPMRRRA